MKEIYLAAGCFWATEKLFSQVEGVESAVCGYANGKEDIVAPSYEFVCTGMTGYRETVKVTFDEKEVSLEKFILIKFDISSCISVTGILKFKINVIQGFIPSFLLLKSTLNLLFSPLRAK